MKIIYIVLLLVFAILDASQTGDRSPKARVITSLASLMALCCAFCIIAKCERYLIAFELGLSFVCLLKAIEISPPSFSRFRSRSAFITIIAICLLSMLVVANTKAARGLTFNHDNASRDLATNSMQDCLSERTLAERSFDAIYGEGAFSRGYDGKCGRFVEFYVALPNLSNMVIRVDSSNQNVAVWKRNTDE